MDLSGDKAPKAMPQSGFEGSAGILIFATRANPAERSLRRTARADAPGNGRNIRAGDDAVRIEVVSYGGVRHFLTKELADLR